MDSLIKWYNEESETHNLIKVAVFVYEFLSIHPFQDGNGRLSRVLTNLLLLQAGYDFVPFISHEKIVEDNKVTLKAEETVYLSAATSYKEISKIPLNEDFESAGSFFKSIERNDESIPLLSTEMRKTTDPDMVFEGSSSGIITLTADTNYVELESISSLLIANNIGWSILEMDYKTDIAFTVGVFIKNDIESVRLPSLTINPKDEWNKIYIHMTPQIGAPTQVSSYKIFLNAYKSDETKDATILLDNIKLIHQ